MRNEMKMYPDTGKFNQDAAVRHTQALSEAGPMGYPMWWKVEHVSYVSGGSILVVWSRPTPMKHR